MLSNLSKELTADNSRFSFAVQPTFTEEVASGDKKKRLFSGVAYSGAVIPNHWYWGNIVFDLHSMSSPSRMPALIDHDRSQRCGYVTQSAITDATGFAVQGILLSNQYGASVAADSDEGFPWQMSVHITPGSIEEVGSGTTVNINGRSLDGPVTVFRNSTLSEVSFTPTGCDSNTSAAAMSRGGDKPPTPKGDNPMDLNQALARVAALEAENTSLQASNKETTVKLTAATDALTKFSADARGEAVKLLFSDLGRDYKADSDEVKAFSAMPQEGFNTTAKMLRETVADQKTKLPDTLFSHFAADGKNVPIVVTNPLMADANARAVQFSKR